MAWVLLACGGGGGGSNAAAPVASSVTVSVDQPTATLTAAKQRTFGATVGGTSNLAVTWSVQEGAAGGVVDAAGTYTAPATPGTFHVVATSAADPTKSATALVTVVPPPSITAFNASATEVLPSGTVNLTATFTNGTAVLNPGMVTLTSGTPAVVNPTTSTVYVLTVTNAAGTSVAAGVSVNVAGNVAVGVLPGVATVEQSATASFQAIVTGALQQGVTWTIQEGAAGGSISPAGIYTPPTFGGTYHVVATSTLDPSKHATSTVTVPKAWQAPLTLSDVADIASYPKISGNDAGDVIATWTTSSTGLVSSVYSASSGTWGAVQTVSSSLSTNNIVAMGATGKARVLYVEGLTLMSRFWNGSAWGAPELIRTVPGGTTLYGVNLAFDEGSSTAIAAWSEDNGSGTNLFASGLNTSVWSTPANLDLYSGVPSFPTAAIRGNFGWVSWTQSDGSYTRVFTSKWNGLTFASAAVQNPIVSGYPAFASGVSLAMKDDGTAYLSFQQYANATATLNQQADFFIDTFTVSGGTWSLQSGETDAASVSQSLMLSRGPQALPMWAYRAEGGVVLDAAGVPSPFIAARVGLLVGGDVATTGQAMFVWVQSGGPTADVLNQLWIAPFDRARLTWGAPQLISSFGTSYFTPAITSAADGQSAVVWSCLPDGATSAQVLVRQFR